MTHNAGPWTYRNGGDFYCLGWLVATEQGLPVADAIEEDDARLIAAAPDLLAACEGVAQYHCACCVEPEGRIEPDSDLCVACKAKAAITKAKG